MSAASDPRATRVNRATALLAEHNLDALVLNPAASFVYFTGLPFHMSERPTLALLTPNGHAFVLPEMERGHLSDLPYNAEAFAYTEDVSLWQDAFSKATGFLGLNGKRIGVEPRALRFLELSYLQAAAPEASFVSAEDLLATMRMQKDAEEIRLMREATQMAEKALENTLPHIRAGMTERELAGELTAQVLRAGSAPTLPFDPLVSFGANSANPHASPGDYPLEPTDIILIDWGANNHHYFSDLTRVFALEPPADELQNVAKVVAAANEAGFQAACPGASAGSIDDATRGVIADAGYGPRFLHRTGHGLGLEVHEEPYIRSANAQTLDVGMTFTIEPGVYLDDLGGIRIEDDVVITEDGAERLSTLPHELRIIG
ncbi:MAG: aminopeptidase P family protein [Rhodothermales bacterium]